MSMTRDEQIRAVAYILAHDKQLTVEGRLEYDCAEDVYRVPISLDGFGSWYCIRGAAVREVHRARLASTPTPQAPPSGEK